MRKLKNEIKIDRAVVAADNASTGEKTMNNSSKKTPWHLRFAPGAILRIVSKAGSTVSAIIQPVRQRLNQWNWRQKTALVTALTITGGGVFYQNRAHAAAFTWPLVAAAAIAVGAGIDFLVNVAASHASSSAINSKIKKTANANPDGWLYRNREYLERKFSYSDNGSTKTEVRLIEAEAMAAEDKTHDTEGTDTMFSPSDLDADEVLSEASHNTNLRRGQYEEYEVLEGGEPLYTWNSYTPNARRLETIGYSWGGYVTKPTAEEIQKDLDDYRADWNRSFQNGSAGASRRPGRLLRTLTKGSIVKRTVKSFTCDKKIKLWSDFEFNRVPGDTSAGPNELQQPGKRPNYVTEFSYIAREAGYDSGIVTRIPENEKPRIDYPEPKSWEDHDFMPFDLTQIPWRNFKIIGTPVWSGEDTRFFKHRKVKWCLQCNQAHPTFNWVTWAGLPWHTPQTRHEIAVYQNESVEKPSN